MAIDTPIFHGIFNEIFNNTHQVAITIALHEAGSDGQIMKREGDGFTLCPSA